MGIGLAVSRPTSNPPADRAAAVAVDPVIAASDRLAEARRTGIPCAPVRDLIGPTDAMAAYEVQRRLQDEAVRGGRRISGRKISLASKAVQTQLRVDQPGFGVLYSDMSCSQDETINLARLMQPRIEAEIAFVLTQDLRGNITPRAVRAAVGLALPTLEIVDSRIADWDIAFSDTVADNASSGLFVLGSPMDSVDIEPLSTASMTLRRNGAVVSRGAGAECMGDPLTAVLWLARTAAFFGDPLCAGDIVLSGALGPMVPVEPGGRYHAEIGSCGIVEAHFGHRVGGPPREGK